VERTIRIGLFVLCLLPFVWVAHAVITNNLGPDPAEALMHATGEWCLRMLALTLLVSPLHSSTRWSVLLKVRRMLGLFAFFYGCVHFVSFLQFFTGWSFTTLLEELVERPYITVGFAAWLLMLPLAVTSTRAMQRRLRKKWALLHRLVYPAAMFACLHLLWQARSDVGEALVYIALFAVLLGWRVTRYAKKKSRLSAAVG
jgi:sulfoxide reductase heme-binding subunit YedZ